MNTQKIVSIFLIFAVLTGSLTVGQVFQHD